jgi:polyadenylate-binding protein
VARNMLGERLYAAISALQPARAGKITGMLLELEPVEIVGLLESRAALVSKVAEAVAVLDEHAARAAAGGRA